MRSGVATLQQSQGSIGEGAEAHRQVREQNVHIPAEQGETTDLKLSFLTSLGSKDGD